MFSNNNVFKINLNQLFILLASVVSTIYLLMLGRYNVLIVDDYLFASKLKEVGIFDFVLGMYNHWQGRYGSFILSAFFYLVGEKYLWLSTVLQLVIGYFSFGCFLKLFLKNNLFLRTVVTVVFVNMTIMSLFEISTFYWQCANSYVMLIFLTFLLSYFVFRDEKFHLFNLPILIVLSFLIGGGAETYTPLIILIYGLIIIFRFRFVGLLKRDVFVKLILVEILLVVFFILLLIAPGNYVRLNYVETELGFAHPLGFDLIMKTFRTMINLSFLIASKFAYYLLIIPVFVYLGSLSLIPLRITNFKLLNVFVLSIVLLFLFLWISLLPGVYAINDLMPLRSLSYVSFVIMLFFAFWSFIFGVIIKFRIVPIRYSLVISMLIFSSLSVYRFTNDISLAKHYKSSIDQRIYKLKKLNEGGFKGLAVVKPIVVQSKQSGYAFLWNSIIGEYKSEKKIDHRYFPYEKFYISENPNDWQNQGFKNYLKLNFDVSGTGF